MIAHRLRGAAFLALLCACTQPEGPQFEPSPAAAAAPRPKLEDTARLRQALAGAAPDAERLAAARGALASRAEALRARAAGLSTPVIPPERRGRLVGAAASRQQPAQP